MESWRGSAWDRISAGKGIENTMKKSESIASLATALANFQGEVSNPKNTAKNPFFKSNYSPLNEVINTVRPIMAKHGLSVLQAPSGDGENITVTTLLMHSSGEWIEGDPLVLRADKITAQGAGSAISYGRRYSLSAILGISSEEEDDGNHATGNKDSAKVEPINKNTTTKSDVNWVAFWNECKKLGFTMEEVQKIANCKDFSKWTKDKASELFNDLKVLKMKPVTISDIPAAGELYASPGK